jgi:hypothetical protein
MPTNSAFLVIPAKAGTQGKRFAAGPWTPACAGVTDKAQSNSKLGLGQRK